MVKISTFVGQLATQCPLDLAIQRHQIRLIGFKVEGDVLQAWRLSHNTGHCLAAIKND